MKLSFFLLTLIFVFLTILVESISFTLQLMGQKLTKWLGKKAFTIHMIVIGFFWIATFCLFVFLQFERHPLFHTSTVLKFTGLVMLISGLILAIWAFRLLGVRRSFGLNFFEDNVPVLKKSLYKYIHNPEDYGLWIALIGLAIFTRSIYNLAIAAEFIIIMIPHIILESKPLKSKIESSLDEN